MAKVEFTKVEFKWWTYQRERFPVWKNGFLIAVFSSASVGYSQLVRGNLGLLDTKALLVAFITVFLFFLQLRIADEFKDLEDDRRYRPYRPVPRGLITLRELGWLAVLSMIGQWGLGIWLHPPLVNLLLLVWIYWGLMSQEFFMGTWLKQHPIVYMLSHMIILPLINFYATACDWLVQADSIPAISWYLITSFLNGIVIEVGRKIRAPQDEEVGVETYSSLWGVDRAVAVWGSVMTLAGITSFFAAVSMGMKLVVVVLTLGFGAKIAQMGIASNQHPKSEQTKWIETLSGLWVITLYFFLGIAPNLLALMPAVSF